MCRTWNILIREFTKEIYPILIELATEMSFIQCIIEKVIVIIIVVELYVFLCYTHSSYFGGAKTIET